MPVLTLDFLQKQLSEEKLIRTKEIAISAEPKAF
jgi:hypothetical protein